MKNKDVNYEYELLSQLAEDGDLFAMRKVLNLAFKNSMQDLNHSEKMKAFKYLKILAENKDNEALLILGWFYYGGEPEFVESDYKKAEYYYNEAINTKPIDFNDNKNTADALNSLGYCYYYGRNNKPDYKKAFQCYGKAACLNHSNAMYKIGDMYKEGLYVKKSIKAAFYWYKKSYRYCSQNDHYITASISQRLGRAYLYGEGTKINLFAALKYLQIAEKGFYYLAIKKPRFSNSIFVNKSTIKTVQKLLREVREKLNNLI
ncbi:MAG: sel1 repeat family protein [Treponema sp.]|jgi:TPR repeat protein|nr:sel1 repeat family protein [Treponema sp.]